MQQSGITYTLIGPDGTTVSLDGSGQVDTPWLVESVDGLDSAEQRNSIETNPEDDGVSFGDFWLGQRSIVFSGKLHASTAAARNSAIVNLQRASRALRSSATLKFQPDGMPAMQISVRREQRLKISGGGWLKDFMLALVAEDPRIYSQTLSNKSATAVAPAGAAFPWVFPVNFGGGSGAFASLAITNAGNYPTRPTIRVWGYVKNPILRLDGNPDQDIFLDNLELFAGEYVDVDFTARTVVKNDGSNLYDKVRRPGSTWWQLPPGSSTVELRGTTSGAGITLDLSSRDAWA